MDPLSQGALGAAFSGSFARKKEMRLALGVGALSGMAADLDVLIRSDRDPLLFIEYHRHFSHSLAFVPFGALICALLFWPFLRKKISFARLYFFSFLGYLTHGLLDACTSYGTLLLWPFSNLRVAWNNIAIVDLLYTLPLLGFIIAAAFARKAKWARVGLAISCAYLCFGLYQHHRAKAFAHKLIESRGQKAERLEVKPTVLNLFIWRLIYESSGEYRVDALRTGPFLEDKVYPGTSVNKYDWQNEIEKLPPGSVLGEDIRRFAWFSDGFLYQDPQNPRVISDLRYSMLPQEILPLWGIIVDPDKAGEHADFQTFRSLRERSFDTLLKMMQGQEIR